MNVLEKILGEIKARKEEWDKGVPTEYEKNVCQGIEIAEEIVEEHLKCSGWIPVTERLPEEGEIVLVTIHTSEYAINYKDDLDEEGDVTGLKEEYSLRDGFRSRGGWYYYSNGNSVFSCVEEECNGKVWITDTVTAWMPLPTPYAPKEPTKQSPLSEREKFFTEGAPIYERAQTE